MMYIKGYIRNKFVQWALLMAAGVCLFMHAGCVRVDKDPTNVVFSPDGTQVAYSWARQWKWLEQDEGYFIGKNTEYVGYGPVDAPDANFLKKYEKSTKVPDYQAKLVIRQVAFSPDSEKIAVVLDDAIEIMDLNTSETNRLTNKDEKMGSLIWLNDDEVAYTAIVPDSDYRKKKKEKYWPATFKGLFRQHYKAPVGGRVELYRDVTTIPDKPPFVAYWSPNNKLVLLAGQLIVRLLNLETGRFTDSILERYGEIRGVAWKYDSSEVFVGFGWNWDQKGKSGAIRLECATGKVTDYGDKIRHAFGAEPFKILDWTKDGKYIVAWGMMTQSCLIQLDPWRILWFEENFSQVLPRYESEYRIIRSLKPGWLWLKTHEDGKTYAVDYYGRFIVPIAERVWATNKEATLIAEIPTRYMIQTRKLVLPKLPPPPKPTPTQKYWTVPSSEIEGSDEAEVKKTEKMLERVMGQKPQPETDATTKPATKPADKKPAEEEDSFDSDDDEKTPDTKPAPKTKPAVPPGMRHKMPRLQEIEHPDHKDEKDDKKSKRIPIEI